MMKFSSLKDKVVFITGGGGGFGETMALDFARQGSHVILVDQVAENAEKLAARIEKEFKVRALAYQVDISKADEVKAVVDKAVKELKRIDILINNAAVGFGNKIELYSDEEWDLPIEVNLNGSYYCIKNILPHMKQHKWGRIINIASIQGKCGFPYTGSYAATKHAVIGLARVVAAEVGKFGITANAVCPGFSGGAGAKRQDAAHKRDEGYTGVSAEECRAQISEEISLGRYLEPAEIAAMVLFLATQEASGVNGQAINVDGGMLDLFTIPRTPRQHIS